MHHISFSSGSSSFNYPTRVQEAQNRFASAPANSPPPATTTSIAQASEGLQRPVTMPSMQAQLLRQLEVKPSHQSRQEGVRHSATTSSPTFSSAELDTMLAKAVDAQRLDIITQAGPSNSPHLNALNKLQQRRFKPAAGGIEIPFTPNSLLGGGGSKRVDTRGTSSRQVQVCEAGVIEERKERIREQIRNQEQVLQTRLQNWSNATDQTERSRIFQEMRQIQQRVERLNRELREL